MYHLQLFSCTMAELSSQERNQMARKAQNVYHAPFASVFNGAQLQLCKAGAGGRRRPLHGNVEVLNATISQTVHLKPVKIINFMLCIFGHNQTKNCKAWVSELNHSC